MSDEINIKELPTDELLELMHEDLYDGYADEIVEEVEKQFTVLTGPGSRIQAGFSMGGYGAWHWALRDPSRFAAVVPIAGGHVQAQPIHRDVVGVALGERLVSVLGFVGFAGHEGDLLEACHDEICCAWTGRLKKAL